MKFRVGDFCDMYKDGYPITRVIIRDTLVNGNCLVEDLHTGNEYEVVPDEEIGTILGNIFD